MLSPTFRRAWTIVFLATTFTAAALTIPKYQGWVTDETGLLGSDSIASLDARLDAIEKQTGVEIAVAVIASLHDESLEVYANTLFRQWGIGKKGANNGVLILIVPSERKMRIEVGYGLEPKLTDGDCGQIVRELMAPAFREGRYADGIAAAIEAVKGHLTGELPSVPPPARRGKIPPNFILLAIFALTIFPGTGIALIIGAVLYISQGIWWGFLLLPAGMIFDVVRYRHGGRST